MADLPAYSNDIEEEMVQAAIEASKREVGEVVKCRQIIYFRGTWPVISATRIITQHAINLFILPSSIFRWSSGNIFISIVFNYDSSMGFRAKCLYNPSNIFYGKCKARMT
ncbi:hypothetical protein U1Q18_042979 [Sarracenia purpurea var. burkii]